MSSPDEDEVRLQASGDGGGDRTPLTVQTVRSETTITVVVSGELDVATVPLLRNELAVPDGADVDIDLSVLGFIDASGVGTLAHASARYRENGIRFRVLRPRPFARRVLTICQLGHLLESRDAIRRSQPADSA